MESVASYLHSKHFRPLPPCFFTTSAIAEDKHYVPPSTNYGFQKLQFYFGYKHTKVTVMLGEEEPRERPQAESLLHRQHSWEHSAASPPDSSAVQAVVLPKWLHIRAEARAKMPCGGKGCWRDLLQTHQSRNWDSEREWNALKLFLAMAKTTGSLCIAGHDSWLGCHPDILQDVSQHLWTHWLCSECPRGAPTITRGMFGAFAPF